MNIYGDNPAEEFSLMENDEKFSQRIKQIENIVNSAIKEIKENNEWTKLSSKWYDKQTSKDARLIIYEIQNHPNIVTICRGIASKNVLNNTTVLYKWVDVSEKIKFGPEANVCKLLTGNNYEKFIEWIWHRSIPDGLSYYDLMSLFGVFQGIEKDNRWFKFPRRKLIAKIEQPARKIYRIIDYFIKENLAVAYFDRNTYSFYIKWSFKEKNILPCKQYSENDWQGIIEKFEFQGNGFSSISDSDFGVDILKSAMITHAKNFFNNIPDGYDNEKKEYLDGIESIIEEYRINLSAQNE